MYESKVKQSSLLEANWGWPFAIGMLLIALGISAIGYSILVSIVAMLWFGLLLVVAGVFEIVALLFADTPKQFGSHVLVALLSVFVGVWIVMQPAAATAAMALIIAIFLGSSGCIYIIYSITYRVEQWGWLLFHGLIALALAIMIWMHWPVFGMWVIGLYISINVLLAGWSLVTLALAARRSANAKMQ